MTSGLLLVLATAALSALFSLVFVVLFFVLLPRFFQAGTLWYKVHTALLLFAYALFPVQVFTNLAAFGGTFGDGATSMFRSITPSTLVAIPSIQLGLFVIWFYLRLTKFHTTLYVSAFLSIVPAFVPASYILLWASMWYHWF
jgi:hypothetical protein